MSVVNGRRGGLVSELHELAEALEEDGWAGADVLLLRLADVLAGGEGLNDYALVRLVERALGPAWAS